MEEAEIKKHLEEAKKELWEVLKHKQLIENRLGIILTQSKEAEEAVKAKTGLLAFTQRLKGQYVELLAYRQGILDQTKIEENRLKSLMVKEKEIADSIGNKLVEETKGLEQIKQQQMAFIEGLEIRSRQIEADKQDVAEREESVKRKMALCEAVKIAQTQELKALESEKARLVKTNELTTQKERQIGRKFVELEKSINENADVKRYGEEELERLTAKQKELKTKEKELAFQEDYIKKSAEILKIREQRIAEERAHLESQQQTLKLAFEEARKKGIS